MIAIDEEEVKQYHNKFWGERSVRLTKEELNALQNGKHVLFDDGEYSWDLTLEKEETEEIWHPAEKKPEHGKDVLLEEKDSGIVYVGHYNKYTDKYIWFDQNTIEVSYWAEIPKRKD